MKIFGQFELYPGLALLASENPYNIEFLSQCIPQNIFYFNSYCILQEYFPIQWSLPFRLPPRDCISNKPKHCGAYEQGFRIDLISTWPLTHKPSREYASRCSFHYTVNYQTQAPSGWANRGNFPSTNLGNVLERC